MGAEAEVAAVASPTPGHAEALARRYGVARWFTDYREMLAQSDIEMVTVTAPNRLHCQMTLDIAAAGKHVVCEKPLCMTLEEADRMIDACNRAGVLLLYAEELFFTPKYVKAKEMADQGAFGRVYLVKQSEKHYGPHADWFWNVEESGGGVLMDEQLGRHAGLEQRAALVDHAHGAEQLVARRALEQVALRAGLDGVEDPLVGVVGREHDDTRVGLHLANLADGPRAVHIRHVQVHQRHVRVQLLGLAHGLQSV
jgi:hypothetical protein